MSHPFNLAMLNRKNLIHTIPTVSAHGTTPVGPKGLYNLKSNQAVNLNVQSRFHDINPQTTPSTFSSANFMDYKIPQNVQVLDKITLYFTIANADATNAWEADLSTEFWTRRIEVRQAGEVLQTIEPLDSYLRHTTLKNEEELEHQEARNGLDAVTYKDDATTLTVDAASGGTYSLDVETLLDQTQMLISGLRHEITIRVYLENIANFSNSAENADITLSSSKMRLREQFYTEQEEQQMKQRYNGDVDHRFCDALIETRTETLTGSTNNKIITQNFDNELSAVTFVVIRDMSAIEDNSHTFIKCENIHFEDQSGHNLNNGVVWSDADLRNYVYPMYFPNNMSISSGNLYIYPFVHCVDPVASIKKGVNSGYDVLKRNHRVVLNPSSTLTSHQIDIVNYVYRHARVSQGVIKIY